MTTMVQVRNVPDELVAALKARAAAEQLSLSDYLRRRLTEFASEPTLDSVLDRLASRPRRQMTASAAQLLHETRAE